MSCAQSAVVRFHEGGVPESAVVRCHEGGIPVHPWRRALIGQRKGSFRRQEYDPDALTAELSTEIVPAQLLLPEQRHGGPTCAAARKEDHPAPRRGRIDSSDCVATHSAARRERPSSAPVHPWIGQRSGSFRRQEDHPDALTTEQHAEKLAEIVPAQLVFPERMHVKNPVIVSMKRNTRGEKLLCVHRPDTKSTALVSFHVSGINLWSHWGCLSSTDRVVELSVPGDEEAAGSVFLVLDTYESMQRLSHMVLGREMPDATTLQVPIDKL